MQRPPPGNAIVCHGHAPLDICAIVIGTETYLSLNGQPVRDYKRESVEYFYIYLQSENQNGPFALTVPIDKRAFQQVSNDDLKTVGNYLDIVMFFIDNPDIDIGNGLNGLERHNVLAMNEAGLRRRYDQLK